MKYRFGPSLYFASDKVIFDSLNQRSVNADLIRELLSERGIIVSSHTQKEDLAKYFSRLSNDYFDHRSISGKLGVTAKPERITYSELNEIVTQDQITQALGELKSSLDEEGSLAQVYVEGDRVVAVITYEQVDYTKTELRQVQPREAIIEFTKGESGNHIIRSTQNSFTEAAVQKLLDTLSISTGKTIVPSRISLEGHPHHEKRTSFFEQLMKNIEGHTFITVTEAFCFKPKIKASIKTEEDEEKELEDQPYVERVGLRGEGVNRSFVIDDLYKNEYYIIKAIWRVRRSSQIDSDHFEIEAQFENGDSCTGFSYQIRNVYLVEEGKVTEKKRPVKSDERDLLYRAIEKAARSSYNTL